VSILRFFLWNLLEFQNRSILNFTKLLILNSKKPLNFEFFKNDKFSISQVKFKKNISTFLKFIIPEMTS